MAHEESKKLVLLGEGTSPPTPGPHRPGSDSTSASWSPALHMELGLLTCAL